MIIILIMGTMISPTEAAVSCTSTSPQCCWARRIRELMGKNTSVSVTSKTACCFLLGDKVQTSGIDGVYCDKNGLVDTLRWNGHGLTGSIPPEIGNLTNLKEVYLGGNQLTGSIPTTIGKSKNLTHLILFSNQLTGEIPSTIGNLVNLQELYLYNNKLTGSIPSTIGNLKNLWKLYVHGNVGLSGAFTPNCGTTVNALGTSLTICGCATQGSPAVVFPPPETPAVCLATGPASPLQKRDQVFSQNIGSYRYTCTVDANGNPFQDCLNTQAKICNTTDMGNDPARLSDCKNGVDKMALNMSTWWQAVRKECGQWPWIDGFTGSKDTTNCAAANKNLIANAYYLANGVRIYVTSNLTTSVNVGLWGNTKLNG